MSTESYIKKIREKRFQQGREAFHGAHKMARGGKSFDQIKEYIKSFDCSDEYASKLTQSIVSA